MAVTKVCGLVDGVEVIMSPDEGDWWSVPVPLHPDGQYVVEIIAENDAGCRAYMAKILFCVDSSGLSVKMQPLPYGSLVVKEPYGMKVLDKAFSGMVRAHAYRAVALSGSAGHNCRELCNRKGGTWMQRIIFDYGERRHVQIEIHSNGDAPFEIKTARYELLCGREKKAEGECLINGHVIDAFITAPDYRTSYNLRFIYEINDETLVEQIELVVE